MKAFKILTSLFFILLTQSAWATTLYIQADGSGLDEIVTAELIKQKLPVSLVGSASKADFILRVSESTRGDDNTWSDIVALSQNQSVTHFKKAAANITRASDGNIVWAGTFDNFDVRTVNFSYDPSGSLAKKIVKRLSKEWINVSL